MQTFLPYPNFEKSLRCLDSRRLGKQRVEAMQILRLLENGKPGDAWYNHPAVRMWRGYEKALKVYHDKAIEIWKGRGFKNTMPMLGGEIGYDEFVCPGWYGNAQFHVSHRSNLLRKNPIWYGSMGWEEPPDLDYMWPV